MGSSSIYSQLAPRPIFRAAHQAWKSSHDTAARDYAIRRSSTRAHRSQQADQSGPYVWFKHAVFSKNPEGSLPFPETRCPLRKSLRFRCPLRYPSATCSASLFGTAGPEVRCSPLSQFRSKLSTAPVPASQGQEHQAPARPRGATRSLMI